VEWALSIKAEDIKLGRHVALKFLPEELAGNPAAIKRLEREARAASALDQPHICAVYDFDQYEGQPFIAMQYLEGQTIRERIDGTRSGEVPFRTEELIEIALQITGALESAHAKGIIHRDIKPANIFLTESGEAKILDFGVAALQDSGPLVGEDSPEDAAALNIQSSSAAIERTSGDLKLTRTGAAIGTASYMSPEQIRGYKLDGRTDLFSFGLVLYEMATGRRAFSGETTMVMREAILHQRFASPRNLNAEIPTGLERIIDRALQKDRDLRYQTTGQIRDDLVRLREHGSRKWKPGRLALLAAAAALVFVLAVVLRRSAPEASHVSDLSQRKLTSNSAENPIEGGGVISPDAKYLAYADHLGIHLQLIETAETTTIPQPEGFDPRNSYWSIAGWFPSSTELLVNARPSTDPVYQTAQGSTIWAVSFVGPPRKIQDNAEAFSVSPDGAWIAFGTRADKIGDHEIWLMGPNRERAHKLFETSKERMVSAFQWSQGGQQVIYADCDKDVCTIVSRDLNGSSKTPVSSWPAYQIHPFLWLRDGRVLYIVPEPGPPDTNCNLWQQRVDPLHGRALDRPARLTNFAGFCLDSLSASADSRHLAFTRKVSQTNILIGDLATIGREGFTPTSLTMSEGYNNVLDWTRDSKAVLFTSDREGRWQIFLQPLGTDNARSVVGAQAALRLSLTTVWGTGARLSPDDHWVLYFINAPDDRIGKSQVLTRVPVAGGPPERVTDATRAATLKCSKTTGKSCVIEERTPETKRTSSLQL
jgi:serine/threonine protein kinase